MSIKNPYGVRDAGEDLIDKVTSCDCCQVPFTYTTVRTLPVRAPRCPNCLDHVLDGSLQQTNEALMEHEPRLRNWIFTVRAKAGELDEENKKLEQRMREQRQQTAAALETRNRHRDVLNAVIEVHQEAGGGTCACAERSPCATVRAMRQADPDLAHYLTTP
jgi:hypothetical protein